MTISSSTKPNFDPFERNTCDTHQIIPFEKLARYTFRKRNRQKIDQVKKKKPASFHGNMDNLIQSININTTRDSSHTFKIQHRK